VHLAAFRLAKSRRPAGLVGVLTCGAPCNWIPTRRGTGDRFGVIASSALVLGALVGGRVQLPKRVLAAMLSFAAGALVTALTFEMFEDSYEQGGIWRAALGWRSGQ